MGNPTDDAADNLTVTVMELTMEIAVLRRALKEINSIILKVAEKEGK